jgi:hypothetical protein
MALSRYDRLLQPTWVLRLTNDELLKAHFAAMLEAGGDESRRVDVLQNEIVRRHSSGTLTWAEWEASEGQKWLDNYNAENERNHG